MTCLIYLDQKDYGALLSQENATLRARLQEWVGTGTAIAPMSIVHWVETSKCEPALRGTLLQVMVELSRGWVLRDPGQILGLEKDGGDVRVGLLSENAFDMLGGGPEALTLPAFLSTMHRVTASQAIHPIVEQAWEAEANRMNSEKENHPTLLAAYTKALGRDVDALELPALRKKHPMLAVTHALHVAILEKVPSGLTGHDIGDTVILGCVLPYFDVVGLDRRMFARVDDAKPNLQDIKRADVARRLTDLVGSLENRIGGLCDSERPT